MTSAAYAPIAPHVIGPYEIVHELGRGGMGMVYRAVRSDGGPPVALKIPFEDMSDYFGCMRREIHALSRLRHPGVVRIVEAGVERGVPWYAMELLDSRSLDVLLDITDSRSDVTDVLPFEPRSGVQVVQPNAAARPDVRGDLQRALTLMYRLARVLGYVHAHGIVHRDLKPENVLVRAGDRPVLVDFGVMGNFRAQSGREVLEIGGVMMGTALYAAPEQCSGELVDARADLYSFGAMLYEIVTGQPPFVGDSAHDVLLMHLMRAPVPPSSLVRGVPPVLEQLILNLLSKKRGDRLGYAEDVAEVLVEAGADPDPDFEIETASYLYRPEVVGRTSTLADLGAAMRTVRSGDGGAFIVLGGESGIGKTSVAASFSREATIGRFRVVTGECDPLGGQPLHPLRTLMREIADYCRGSEGLVDRVIGPRLQVLRELDPALDALADESVPHVSPEIASRRLFADVGETLAAFAHEQPVLLILDDLQWADEVTLRFLASLGGGFFNDLPLLILGTFRSDETGPDLRELLAKDYVRKILLGRLGESEVGEIVRSMLAAPDAPQSFLQFLAQESEGNPFFVAEYLRAAVSEQLLVRESGRWRVVAGDGRYSSLGLPGTLRDLVGRRLDKLSPVAQRVAEAAAVLGREVPETLLIAMCAESDIDALDAMAELVERHVFDAVEHGVRFAHDKLREAAYARIAADRLRMLHGRAAEEIEKRCHDAEQLKRHAAQLARHCDLAGWTEKAVRYYAQGAEAAVGTGACREAVELMTRALELDASTGAESSAERAVRHARWQRVLSQAHFGLGDLVTSGEHARRSLGEVGVDLPRGNSGWGGRLLLEVARQSLHLALPRRLFRAREARKPLLLEAALSAQKFSEGSYYAAEMTVMLASGLLAVNAAERLGDVPGVVHAYSNLAVVASGLGLHWLADRYFEEGRRLATAANDLDGLAHIGFTSIAHYVATCDWKRCAEHADEAVEFARRAGDDQVTETCETGRGFYEFYTGKLAKSVETYVAVRDGAHKRSNRQHEAWGHSGLARSYILMGRLDEALEGVRIGRTLLEGQNDRMSELILNAHEPLALLHQDRLDAAVEAADATCALVAKNEFLMWEMFRGLSAPAEVYLEVWARARKGDAVEVERMRRTVLRLLRGLRSLSRRAPLVVPVTARLAGVAECLQGNLRRGENLLRRSASEAARLGLPLDEGIAEYELVRHAILDPGERSVRRERARAIFRATGCDLYLQKMGVKDDSSSVR